MNKIALFDIDGVLADDRHRIQFALDKRWPEYFRLDRMAADGVWEEGRKYVATMENLGYEIHYLTGRREDTRETTQNWLYRNGFPTGSVFMKRLGETKKLAEYKVEFITALRESELFDSIVLFDDDPRVVEGVRDTHGPRFIRFCSWYTKQWPVIEAGKA